MNSIVNLLGETIKVVKLLKKICYSKNEIILTLFFTDGSNNCKMVAV